MESVRAKHAAELEAKRKKLEEIRKRKASVRATEDASSSSGASESVNSAIDAQEHKFDDFIQNILNTTASTSAAGETGAAGEEAAARAPVANTLSLAEKLSLLSTMTNVAEVHIQPTLVEMYTKHTETDITLEHEIYVRDDSAMDVDDANTPLKRHKGSMDATTPLSPRRNLTIDTDVNMSESGVGTDAMPTMSEEDKKQLMQSDAMEAFLTRASRVIERALTSTSKYDIMIDYGAAVEKDKHTDETVEVMSEQFKFVDPKWTAHRAVTDIDVSPFYPELTLVSYTARDFLEEEDKSDASSSKQWDTMGPTAALADIASVTDGVVLLWSTALPTRPEYRFTCHSQITSACFNPFDRHLIFGGTYSGQIVIWDTRAKSAPVQKTSLSSCSHTHPIYSMAVVGTKSSYNLISASTDGRVCIWDMDQLQQPIDMLDLRIALSIVSNYTSANISTDKKMEASVTSFAIHRKEPQELYIGTEAGKLYSTKLDPQKSKAAAMTAANDSAVLEALEKQAKSGFLNNGNSGGVAREVIVNTVSKEGTHFGPVTAMHFNPLLPVHREGLLITASLDSTVKVWSTEHPYEPVFSFEPSSEYVCDVRWSSVHPALFAVADGSGRVSLWNICKDMEVPAVEVKVGEKALNKIRWSVDGKSIIVGDANGDSFVYEVPSDIALPQSDDLFNLEAKVAAALAAATIAKQ